RDWSSDVCSSDLLAGDALAGAKYAVHEVGRGHVVVMFGHENSLIAGKLVGTLGSIGGAGDDGDPRHFTVAHPVAPRRGLIGEGAQFATNAHGRVLPPLSGRAFDDEVDQPGDEPLGYANRRGT